MYLPRVAFSVGRAAHAYGVKPGKCRKARGVGANQSLSGKRSRHKTVFRFVASLNDQIEIK